MIAADRNVDRQMMIEIVNIQNEIQERETEREKKKDDQYMDVETLVTYLTMPLPITIAEGDKIKRDTDTVSEGNKKDLEEERKKEEDQVRCLLSDQLGERDMVNQLEMGQYFLLTTDFP
ncbi:MAG: hypothetical protein EZS28_054745, partial [Streblomastix strix]